ncbi:MAG: hypothetical protein WDN04_26710 [Rhodospirillales bacterium]
MMPIEQLSPVCLMHRALDRCREFAGARPGVVCDAREAGEVEIDFVDAAVLDFGHNAARRRLEQPRVLAVLLEVDGQQHRVGRELSGLHQAHRRVQAECARLISGGGNDPAAGVSAQRGKPARHGAGRRVGHGFGLVLAAAADDHRPAAQFRVSQQFHRRVKRVHVEMGDDALPFHLCHVADRDSG